MVGHTGDFAATVSAVGTVDLCVGRLLEVAKETGTVLLITADHGNADALYELNKKTQEAVLDENGVPKNKTSHTLAEVPFIIANPNDLNISINAEVESPGLANIAATALEIAGFEPPKEYESSLLKWENNTPEKEKTERKKELSANEEFEIAKSSVEFAETIARLRAPDGCPWDKEQTFSSLQKYLLEETYEAVEALNEAIEKDKKHGYKQEHYEGFADELGDVLLQIFLNSQIAKENNNFDIVQVINSINNKMIRRHPHVFSSEQNLDNSNDVITQWEKIKANEKGDEKNKVQSLLHKALKKTHLPSLEFGVEVSYRSRKIGFAWPTLTETFKDIEKEVDELREIITLDNLSDPKWLDRVWDETGDILYAVCNLMSWFHVNSDRDKIPSLDIVARSGITKFINRFFEMEKIYFEETGKPLTDKSIDDLQEWDQLWAKAKERRYR